MITIAVVNGRETQEILGRFDGYITEETEPLFRSIGDALVADTQRRIQSSNGGTWRRGSKWLRAKTGQSKVLLGAERFVRARVSKTRLELVGKGGKWTLSQHDEGFTNELFDENERMDEHGRVILRIADPRPLGLKPGRTTFAFIPQREGETPARKIWPSREQADAIIKPLASRWLTNMARKAGAL